MGEMRVARMIRVSLALAGAALIGFHGWLFAAQAAAGRLDDPWLVFRWIAAASLIAALIGVRRGGAPMFGRKSVAIWVLAVLLHGPAISNLPADFTFAVPATVATTLVQVVASAAVGAALLLLAAALLALRRATAARYAAAPIFVQAGGLAPRLSRHFCPRPPPLRKF
jgi:hypothetical protein